MTYEEDEKEKLMSQIIKGIEPEDIIIDEQKEKEIISEIEEMEE